MGKCTNMLNSPNFYGSCEACTDANSYTASATSVDLTLWKIGEYWPGKIYYNAVLEFWNGTIWEAKEQQLGYFEIQSPVKKFYLAGKPEGSYRFTIYINLYCQNCGETYINRTHAFTVDR